MKKMKFIASVRVGSPCDEDWNEMIGNDKVRFCTHCAKDVNNLSEMTRKEALRLVRRSGGNLCIRYIQHPVTRAPVFSGQLIKISRRAPRMAAGVMTAGLSLATLTYAQGDSVILSRELPDAVSRMENKSCPDLVEKTAAETKSDVPTVGSGHLTGIVTDPNDAVIAGAAVIISDSDGNEVRHGATNEDGTYSIKGLGTGVYSVSITSPGFPGVYLAVRHARR